MSVFLLIIADIIVTEVSVADDEDTLGGYVPCTFAFSDTNLQQSALLFS